MCVPAPASRAARTGSIPACNLLHSGSLTNACLVHMTLAMVCAKRKGWSFATEYARSSLLGCQHGRVPHDMPC